MMPWINRSEGADPEVLLPAAASLEHDVSWRHVAAGLQVARPVAGPRLAILVVVLRIYSDRYIDI